LALWEQIASHYRDFPDNLFFELLNEPSGQLSDEQWQQIFPNVLHTIRRTNPNRIVIIGPGHWNSFDHLQNLNLPEEDRRLIVTFHYYSPMQFTHQGASWVSGSAAWKGTAWTGTPAERERLAKDFREAAAWASRNRRPLYLGEFGAYQGADLESRVRWTAAVAREAEKNGFSWSYWEFCSGFGAYDAQTSSWRQPLLRALIPKP
jgi:endoglucanase